jgi:hypothetical protein
MRGLETRRAEHGDRRPNVEEALESADELALDPHEPGSLARRGARVCEEVGFLTDGQLVAGKAGLAPVALPLTVPLVDGR